MPTPPDSEPAMLALLARERQNFVSQFERVPSARRTAPAADGGWSPVQVAEHVAPGETGVARMIIKGASLPRAATDDELVAAQITESKVAIVRDRTVKVQAPERTHPVGAVTAETAVSQLEQSRAELLAAYHAAEPAVLDGVTFTHPFVGPLTLRAWMELVAHHDARHAQQLQEFAP